MSQYEYQLAQFRNGSVELVAIRSELRAAGLLPGQIRLDVAGVAISFAEELGAPAKAAMDAVVANHNGNGDPLKLSKQTKLALVNAKTAALIGSGSFEYPSASGKLFGLSEVSQLNITGAFNSRNESGFVYPVIFFTKDDLDSVSLADADEVAVFHGAAVDAIRVIRDGGAALKARVNAATAVAQVEAIVDTR